MEPIHHFTEILTLIQQARQRAVASVNRELIDLYQKVGGYISQKIEISEWGDGTVVQLARYLQQQHPDLKGFSRQGLYRMRQFYEAYRNASEIVSPLVRQLSWTHHLILLSQCKTPEERQFYLFLAVKESSPSRTASHCGRVGYVGYRY
jgi:hypothetical protein